MSNVRSLKENFTQLKNEWQQLDPTIRFLDLVSIGLVALFGITYIVANVIKITFTVTNAAMLIFPLILTGYIYVLRSKLVDEEKDNQQAKREFFMLVGITLVLILSTILYSILLNQVLI